jgi:hypothetical protein
MIAMAIPSSVVCTARPTSRQPLCHLTSWNLKRNLPGNLKEAGADCTFQARRLSRLRGKSVLPQPLLIVVLTVRGPFKTAQFAGRCLPG